MLLGGYKSVYMNDVAVFASSKALSDWLSAKEEKDCACYSPEDAYFQREVISEEDAILRLSVDSCELPELERVKDDIYNDVFWLVPPHQYLEG